MSVINREDALRICDNAINLWKGQLGEGALIAVRKSILSLPDADDGWISVEERLPEENGEYLVTRESVFYRYIDIVRKSNCNGDLPMASDIKAWMPLPKPYEPKEDK